MATIEKLVKAFEGLKVFQPGGANTDDSSKKKEQPPSKKDKILHCNVVADCICAQNMRTIADFPKFLGIAVEAFLTLCDDAEADIRMVADECLNRTIKTLLETNLGRLQVELYKEIKKNGASRSLRAALWRFADMCHLIRPQKCRPYIVNLLPYIARICRREEEAVQETLSNSMPKICSALMAFANESEVKALLKSFLTNLVSPSAVCRRMAASSLSLICQYSRSPISFFTYLVTVILELVLPVDKEHDVYTLLGVILCLRHAMPHLTQTMNGRSQGLKDSFGFREMQKEEGISDEQLLKILQLLLFHTGHPDHNVVTASLEALQQMLKHPHPTLLHFILTQGGISKTYIFQADFRDADLRAESSTDLPSMLDDTGLDEDLDTSEMGCPPTAISSTDAAAFASDFDSSCQIGDSDAAKSEEAGAAVIQIGDGEVVDTTVIVTGDSDYSNVEIGDLNEDRLEMSNLSHSSSAETLLSIKSISPKRLPPANPEGSFSSVQHDMNGNPEYDQLDQDDLESSEAQGSLASANSQSQKDVSEKLVDIGSLLDPEELPLLYILRLLCKSFLLKGEIGQLVHDRHVRVSLKSLALGCVSSICSLCPKLALCKLVPSDKSSQDLSDVLLYASHPDHQLKGLTALCVGSLIHAVLVEGRGDFNYWFHLQSTENDAVTIEHLLKTLVGILDDDSAVATRHSLSALQLCMPLLLDSCHGRLGLQLLLDLIKVKANPYWLVKVELLEILGSLNFKKINYLESISEDIQQGEHHFQGRIQLQQHYLQKVIFPLLGDEDTRVRNAASVALNRLIPNLFFPMDNPQHDAVISVAKDKSDSLLYPIMHEFSMDPPPFVQGLVAPYHFNILQEAAPTVESSLSRIVQMLMHQLLVSQSRFMTSGCCRALCRLSEEYLVTPYASAWGCGPAKQLLSQDATGRFNVKRPPSRSLSSSSSMSLEELTAGIGGGPLPVVLSLMLSTQATLDLSTHQDMLQLAGNLIAGSAYKSLRSADEMASITGAGEEGKWAAIMDRMLVPPIEQLLIHVARILNACTHVIDETVPGPPQAKPSLPSLANAPSLSPVKRKVKGSDKEPSSPSAKGQAADAKTPQKTPSKEPKESEKEKSRKEGIGTFYNLPQYVKLYEVLRGAYSNYKISLDLNSADKFCSFVRTTLDVMAQLLEIATLFDIGKHAEEILNYFKSTVILEPTSTVLCVQQLLKALFGTNLASQWECEQQNSAVVRPGKATRLSSSGKPGLYHNCLGQPYAHLTHSLLSSTYKATAQVDTEDPNSSLLWLKKRVERKVPAILKPSSKVDKAVISSYIRLFEPLVIKALKQYTVTSCLELQRQVLDLLTQLIQLRVNYCLLDSDMIFISFVLKQFEILEEGQIRNSEVLVPHIFQFLVMLSYEKYHSKPIIDMPKIIHRCDGIMASGTQPDTHAIPSLQPIVYDLFLLRGTARSDVSKELETQREVVVSMLLRLVHYHQALELFVIILQQCHRENEDRWKRMSRMVTDAVMPALVEQQVTVNSQPGLDILHRLFESVAPSVFRPVDILLKTLLAAPLNVERVYGVERWMCLVLALLRVLVSQSKEEAILSRLEEMGLHVNLTRSQSSTDMSASVMEVVRSLSAEETVAWFLLQVIGKCAETLSREKVIVGASACNTQFLQQQVTHLMLYITHMFQSGLFRRVATAAMRLLQNESPACFYSIREINQMILALSTSCPMLTLHWCNVLILLNYDDRQFWSQIVQTPQSFKMISQSGNRGRQLDPPKRIVECCNLEMLRRGGLILFCDYVCENLSDAEHMTWLIINHVTDLIELSNESPVQDFISAIHRNPAASSLFIQAIHARGESVCRHPSLVKKTLRCLEAIHPSQSGALVTLLIDKFLYNHQLAVTGMCDSIICRRLEGLLAESAEESSKQLPQEDLEKLLHFMKSNGLVRRHERLASLLDKLKTITCPSSQVSVSPQRTHPLVLTATHIKDIETDKEFFISVAKDQCFSPSPRMRECAFLLQRLDYADILSITMTKEFNLSVLEECISLGAFRTLLRYSRDKDSDQATCGTEPSLDPLFQAAQLTMFRHINNVINHLPVPHQCLNFTAPLPPRLVQYMDRIDELFTDHVWFDMNFSLAAAFAQYIVCIRRFPWEACVPAESKTDVCRFCVLLLEMVHWSIQHDSLPTSDQLQMCMECVACVLQDSAIWSMVAQDDHATWVCSLVAGLHQLLASVLVLPGERVSSPTQEDHTDDHTGDDVTSLIHACDQVSELVHCLQTRLHPSSCDSRRFPTFLSSLMRNIIVDLARLPLVNTYARTPPIVWRLGWSPSPSGTHRTQLPPLPVEFLQEKDVLKEFVTRINTLGWTNRQQFEESWMSLLGVLNPASPTGHPLSSEEEIEQSQGMVIAVRAITALLLQAMFVPHAGNPANSQFEIRPRDKPLAFLTSRCGKKLSMIRGLIEQEVRNLCALKPDRLTHHPYSSPRRKIDSIHYDLFEDNLEREFGTEDYSLGQISLESIWAVVGSLDQPLTESDTTDSLDSPQPDDVGRHAVSRTSSEGRERSISLSGLDIHSCLQFLLELYGAWLHVDNNPKPPLMLVNAVVKSMVCLSDLFMEREQFEFMLDTLLDVVRVHPVEDELVNQYLTVGLAKATAVVGVEATTAEKVSKIIEQGLKSTHLPTKVSSLHSVLYLLEGGLSDVTRSLLPVVSDFLLHHLTIVSQACIISQQFVITLWATAFYLAENFHDELKDTEFCAKMMQLVTSTASGNEESVSTAVFLAIMKGTERLLLADVLSRTDTESVIKLSMDRLCLPNPQRALAALGLMFTCMYSGKSFDQYSPLPRDEQVFSNTSFETLYQDPESLILAMERVTVLFDRIKKGYPYEARVITRLLPAFLADFFPPQDIMNKVIGEFLSSQQPYPHLIAKVVFQVFNNLHQQSQQGLVQEWVMLSLSNFTQRSPVAMATWSLTCFFISASTNIWLKALFPHVLGRMGKLEVVDRRLFCLAALDFFRQLTDDMHRRSFLSTFQSVAGPESPYTDLLACLANAGSAAK